jgi:hypothetical protein
VPKDVFRIRNGPLLDYSPDSAGWYEATMAKEAECDQAVGYLIRITNQTDTHLWIENIYFRLHDLAGGLIPIYSNREHSHPHKLPVSLQSKDFAVEYAVPFPLIPPVVEKAVGIRIRYRNYYVPMPLYKSVDHADTNFHLFIRALRLRNEGAGA